jgi:hypothetical protein
LATARLSVEFNQGREMIPKTDEKIVPRRLRLIVRGAVQGVGFRPLFTLARKNAICADSSETEAAACSSMSKVRRQI